MTKLHISPDLSLPLEAVTRRLAILAMSGAGKSNVAVVMAEQMYDAGIPWVAIDPKGDWWGVRSSKDGKGPGLPVPIFGGLHGDIPLEHTAGKLIAQTIVDQRLTCVLDISEFAERQQQWGFLIDLGETLLRLNRQALHLFLEEADEYLPQRTSEKGNLPKCLGVWQRVVKRGRFRGIGSTQITQRNASLNKDTLYQAEALIAMRVSGKADREAVKGWVEYHNASAEIVASLPSLADGEGWLASPAWLRTTKRIKFDRRRTFDSGATPIHLKGNAPPATLADVDLEKLRVRMAATIEKVKADDPRELRKQIATLKKELGDTQRSLAAHAGVSGKEVTRATQQAAADVARQHAATIKHLRDALGAATKFIINISTKNFDVAGVDKAELERVVQSAMAKATEMMDRKLTARAKDVDDLRLSAQRIAEKLKRVLEADGEPVVIDIGVTRNEPFTVDAPHSAARSSAPRKPVAHRSDSDLPAGAQKLLNAAARLLSVNIDTPTRTQVAALAPMSPTSSATERYFAKCIELEYFSKADAGSVRLTDAGLAVATPVDAPPTLEDYVAEWQRLLGSGAERKLYDAMVNRTISRTTIKPIARAELAELAEISSTSSATERGFAWLIGLDLLQKAGTGEVKPGPTMFPEGLS